VFSSCAANRQRSQCLRELRFGVAPALPTYAAAYIVSLRFFLRQTLDPSEVTARAVITRRWPERATLKLPDSSGILAFAQVGRAIIVERSRANLDHSFREASTITRTFLLALTRHFVVTVLAQQESTYSDA